MDLQTIYLICAIAGGSILILRLLLMVIGIDHSLDTDVPSDVSVDLNHDVTDTGGGTFFSFFSIQSISGFFTMFGLVGMGLLQIDASDLISLLGALAAGVFTAWATGMIFIGMTRLQSEGTLVIQNAIGQEGTVYLTIPEKGSGEVSVPIQGSTRIMDAVSENGQRIATGTIVQVTGVTGAKYLIVREKI